MKNVIVIHEIDKNDKEISVIGVATSRIKALEMIDEYYGKGNYIIINFKDVREGNIDFRCIIEVKEPHGGMYYITGEDFIIDSI